MPESLSPLRGLRAAHPGTHGERDGHRSARPSGGLSPTRSGGEGEATVGSWRGADQRGQSTFKWAVDVHFPLPRPTCLPTMRHTVTSNHLNGAYIANV